MIGKILRKMRMDSHLSQQQLADILKIDQTTLSGWERGYREPIFEMIEKIASVCNYSIVFENKENQEKISTQNIQRKE